MTNTNTFKAYTVRFFNQYGANFLLFEDVAGDEIAFISLRRFDREINSSDTPIKFLMALTSLPAPRGCLVPTSLNVVVTAEGGRVTDITIEVIAL